MACSSTDSELVLDARAFVGEGPVWDAGRERLLWVDVADGLVHAFHPASSVDRVWAAGEPVGAVALASDGGLIAAVRDGFALFSADGEPAGEFVEVETDIAANRMNDGKCDCRGRFWAGTMATDHAPLKGTLYRVDRERGRLTVSAHVSGVTISNGLDWSVDSSRMYYVDSATQRIDVFDFDIEHGRLSNRRPFVEIPKSDGLPDGMLVDAEDHVWVALFGGGRLRRYRPCGEISMEVRVPVSLVTSCAFGGPDLADLYITTARHRLSPSEAVAQQKAGGLFLARPGPSGRLPYYFGG